MVFNGDTNNQDIVSLANRLAKTSTNRYPLTEKAQDATGALHAVWALIYEAYGGWRQADANDTDLPEYTRDLTSSVQFYELPDEAEDLFSVSWKDASGTWIPLRAITEEQVIAKGYSISEYQKTSGNPREYIPLSNGFKIFPASDTTRADALRVEISRGMTAFAPSDLAISPGFDVSLHESIPVFMARRYTMINARDKFDALNTEWLRWEGRIKTHAQQKYRQMFPPALRHRKDFARQFKS